MRRWSQAERDNFSRVAGIIHDIVGGHWLSLRSHALPVNSREERVRFERVVPFHPKATLRPQLQKLINERLEVLIDESRWPLKLSPEDLIEDDHLSATKEGRLSAGHLVEDHSEGPKVGKGARLGLVEHFRRHIQGRPHKRIRSFSLLDVLQLLLRACEEWRAEVLTVVQRFAVAVIDL